MAALIAPGLWIARSAQLIHTQLVISTQIDHDIHFGGSILPDYHVRIHLLLQHLYYAPHLIDGLTVIVCTASIPFRRSPWRWLLHLHLPKDFVYL